MKQFFAPNGLRIVGTLENIPGTALVSGFDDEGKPIYAGGTEVNWDGQTTKTDAGDESIIGMDEEGQSWRLSECVEHPD